MIEEREIFIYRDGRIEKKVDEIVKEYYLRIFINNREIAITGIFPEKIEYFIYGFLYTNEIIRKISDIKGLKISQNLCYVEIENEISEEFSIYGKRIGSGCGSDFINFKKEDVIEGNIKIKGEKILSLVKKFSNISEVFKKTGAVHSCGISDGNEIIIFSDDISRHNAFDKVIGECLFKNLNLNDKIILTTGRASSDIVIKCVKAKIPFIISISAPTDYAIKISDFYNITLIGFARGKRFNIYTHKWRIQ